MIGSGLLAFLGTAAAFVAKQEVYGPPAPPKPPEFKQRWWYAHNRLDARPCIWSLENRPGEWDWGSREYHQLYHKPSNHQFYVNGMWSRMGAAPCSCQSASQRGKFHSFQGAAFARAVAIWDKKQILKQDIPGHFREHFVPTGTNVHG